MLAYGPIKSLLIQTRLVFLPPGHAAFIRAVPLRLLVGCLNKRFSAVAAQPLVIIDVRIGHRVSMTVNFYCILGNASKFRDLFGGKAVQLVVTDLDAFLVSHSEVLLLRERCTLTT